MPCCWAPTETAATSSRPPAWATAWLSASHQASGWTCVPSGWAARPVRTSAPVSASRTTTLQDWVDESTPATRGIGRSARAEQVLERELVQRDEPVAAGSRRVEACLIPIWNQTHALLRHLYSLGVYGDSAEDNAVYRDHHAILDALGSHHATAAGNAMRAHLFGRRDKLIAGLRSMSEPAIDRFN